MTNPYSGTHPNNIKDAQIISWFIIGLRHGAIRLAKKYKRLQKHELLILNDRINQYVEDDFTELLDHVIASDNVQIETEDNMFLQEVLNLLTIQQQEVIKATVLEGKTEEETANELEISQPSVHRMKKRALRRIERYFSILGVFTVRC